MMHLSPDIKILLVEFETTSESLKVCTVDIAAATSHIRVLTVDTDIETEINCLRHASCSQSFVPTKLY
jgi:hypothetical protein